MTEPARPARSYEQRHSEGLESLATLAGVDDATWLSDKFSRRRGFLGTLSADLIGDTWARPGLTRRERSIVVLSCLFVHQAADELGFHLRAALRHGLKRDEIDEIVLHVAGYAGFPPAMHAHRVVDATWRELDGVERLPDRQMPDPVDDATRRARGTEVMATMSGRPPTSDPEKLYLAMTKKMGGVGAIALEWAFGELWARPEMARRDRSLAVLAILTMLGMETEMRFHIRAAINHGLSRGELEEMSVQLAIYAGIPRAINAFRLCRETWRDMDGLDMDSK